MAAEAQAEQAGNREYADNHLQAIFKEGLSFSGYERDFLALGRSGDGFLDVSGVSGIDSIGDGRGAAFADFDNDGDLDVFLVSLQGEAHRLFRNNVGQSNRFLRIALVGGSSGRDAFGAVVRVKTSAGVLTKLKSGGSGFLAQHDPRLLFGLGDDPAAEWVEVTWPAGGVVRIGEVDGKAGIAAGTSLEIGENGSVRVHASEARFTLVDPLTSEDALLATLDFDRGDVFPDLGLLRPSEIPGAAQAGLPSGTSLHQRLRPGRRTLVNLWATWCVPCRREMPELQALAEDLATAGIDLVGLSIDTDTIAAVVPFLEEVGVSYPVHVTHDEGVAGIFVDGQVSVPLSILLDDHGRVLRVIGGWSAATAAEFRALAGTDRRQ